METRGDENKLNFNLLTKKLLKMWQAKEEECLWCHQKVLDSLTPSAGSSSALGRSLLASESFPQRAITSSVWRVRALIGIQFESILSSSSSSSSSPIASVASHSFSSHSRIGRSSSPTGDETKSGECHLMWRKLCKFTLMTTFFPSFQSVHRLWCWAHGIWLLSSTSRSWVFLLIARLGRIERKL